MALENLILGERSQTQNPTYCMILLYEMSRRGKSIDLTESRLDTESRFVVAKCWDGDHGEGWEVTAKWVWASFCVMVKQMFWNKIW